MLIINGMAAVIPWEAFILMLLMIIAFIELLILARYFSKLLTCIHLSGPPQTTVP